MAKDCPREVHDLDPTLLEDRTLKRAGL